MRPRWLHRAPRAADPTGHAADASRADGDTTPPPPRVARSLLAEILDWMLAPLLMLWPLSIAVTWLIAKSIAGAPFDHALERRLAVLARQVHQAGPAVLSPLPTTDADWLLDDPDDTVLFQVRDAQGKVVAGTAQLPAPPLRSGARDAGADNLALDADADVEPGIVRMRDVVVAGRNMRLAWTRAWGPPASDAPPSPQTTASPSAIAAPSPQAPPRVLVIQVAETLNKRNALANDVIKGVILPQLIILPVVILLVWFGLTRGLAPLHVLQRRIRTRSPDDRSPLMPGDAPTELAPLLSSFNELLGRLDANTTAQKRFIAQAAHQMKTPLAGLRMQAEMALRHPVPPDVRRSLEQIATSSHQAARLVSQLLALARTEEAAPLRTAVALDAAMLCREVVHDWARAAIDKVIDLGYEGPDNGVTIVGQPLLLREMLTNLIDNAIRYTPSGGRVTVRLQPGLHDDAPTLIDVEDDGPGIPIAERPRVVERFYRILGREGDGSGLGLAIVQEIVTMHDGTLTIEDHVYQTAPRLAGTSVRVTLPQRAPSATPAA
ncbi:sensor histidine kinase N-terminal domain-containing protein [Robbsia sp. KACC 23696]|uniref:sensor histidine kinase n=1 Tax=Robbsia sp. KACC 23696 TaxID=3149231 RepID=UPI00325B170C